MNLSSSKRLMTAMTLVLWVSLCAGTDIENFKQNTGASVVNFTENNGQVSDQFYLPRPDVLFSGEVGGLTFHIRDNGVSYQTSRIDSWRLEDKDTLRLRQEGEELDSVPNEMTIYRTDINWLNFNKDYSIVKGEAEEGYNNYYLASCPDGALNVRSYSDVTFNGLYDGVDLKWYDNNGELEYDYIVSPNADYRDISWEIKGADKIFIGEDGQLIIQTPLGNIEEQAPVAYQGSSEIEANWSVNGDVISFKLGEYNTNETVIIDPVVRLWGTYYGRVNQNNFKSNMTIDANGDIYMVGTTESTIGFATTGAFQTSYGGGSSDCYLVKFNASGVRQWGTYYGGSGIDVATSISTDVNNNLYMAGHTASTGVIASSGAHQITNGGGLEDGFLVKFSSSGLRQWGTYYGGTSIDIAESVSTDAIGNVYMCGATGSSGSGIIATPGAYSVFRVGYDAFLVKFNASGVRQWGTYYGERGADMGNSIITDATGNIYLAGHTSSTSGISTTGAFQTSYGGGVYDCFLVKFNSSGLRQWGTYYGGGAADYFNRNISIDGSSNIYMTGRTESTTGIATANAHQTNMGGGTTDAFLVKFNASGARQWSTYYGSTSEEQGFATATDNFGNIYLAGTSSSTGGIATANTHQPGNRGGDDAFLVKFNGSGVRQWGTYYGGTSQEYGKSVSIDATGNVYLGGSSRSLGFIATPGAYLTSRPATIDHFSFLVKFYICPSIVSQTAATSCNSYTWPANNQTYTSTGSYSTTLTNSLGCDSIVTLNLTINNSNIGSQTVKSCGSYTWPANSQTYTSTGSYTTTLTNAIGCDSVVTLNLTINNTYNRNQTVTSCDSYTWAANSQTYTSTGSYTTTLTNGRGCDTIVTLNLTINNSNIGSQTVTSCGSYTWPANSQTYTSTGSYSTTLTNSLGCDSIVTLNLTINNSNIGSQTVKSCGSYTWPANSQTYTSTGSYTTTLTNAIGCDSVATLNLTINPIYLNRVTATVCEGDDYITQGGQVVSSSGVYRDTLQSVSSCDSIIETNLTQLKVTYDSVKIDTSFAVKSLSGKEFIATGIYLDTLRYVSGCDSIILYYDVNLNLPYKKLTCQVFPNPTNETITIEFDELLSEGLTYQIFNIKGDMIASSKINNSDPIIDVKKLPRGTYLLNLLFYNRKVKSCKFLISK